ncbi:MAG TPA: hypothetical protein PKC67_12240 [Kiritimatiellia bacterium]|nr:hypothetical protein [Kiritimatiellia bacterium]HMP35108.1 hypothetical protein [Kiritimatiellia bacterium]
MRGRPWWQWLAFAAGWLALAWPILRVTDADSTATPSAEVPAGRLTHAWVTIECSARPSSVAVLQGDRVVWRDDAPSDRRFETDIELAIDDLGVDFTLEVALPDGNHAVEVTLDVDGFPRRARTVWTEGPLAERIEFLWGAR